MTTYFSVDVETTGPSPAKGELLSIGAVTVYETDDGLELDDNGFYINIELPKPEYRADEATMKWWNEQEPSVRAAAFNGTTPKYRAAIEFYNWVTRFDLDPDQICFVANPAAFDYKWIEYLFDSSNISINPFGYRSLCLRSMRFGLTPNETWGKSRGEWHKPKIPHDPYWDAYAQAEDLITLLNARDAMCFLPDAGHINDFEEKSNPDDTAMTELYTVRSNLRDQILQNVEERVYREIMG